MRHRDPPRNRLPRQALRDRPDDAHAERVGVPLGGVAAEARTDDEGGGEDEDGEGAQGLHPHELLAALAYLLHDDEDQEPGEVPFFVNCEKRKRKRKRRKEGEFFFFIVEEERRRKPKRKKKLSLSHHKVAPLEGREPLLREKELGLLDDAVVALEARVRGVPLDALGGGRGPLRVRDRVVAESVRIFF